MHRNVLPTENRDCPHCHQVGTLRYYKEGTNKRDKYYCEGCFGLVLWDGNVLYVTEGEAYPNREKK